VSNVKIVALAVAMLLFGGILGGLSASVHWVRKVNGIFANQGAIGAGQAVRILKMLRENKPEAAARALEAQLDGDILTLASFAKGDTAQAERSRVALRKAAAYRRTGTYTSPFEEPVSKALALGDSK
jgi:hypothetical protein